MDQIRAEALWREFDGLPLYGARINSDDIEQFAALRGYLTISLVQNALADSVNSRRSIDLIADLKPLAVSAFGKDANAVHDCCDETLYAQGELEVVTLAFPMSEIDVDEIVFGTLIRTSPFEERDSDWKGRLVLFGAGIDGESMKAIRLAFMSYSP